MSPIWESSLDPRLISHLLGLADDLALPGPVDIDALSDFFQVRACAIESSAGQSPGPEPRDRADLEVSVVSDEDVSWCDPAACEIVLSLRQAFRAAQATNSGDLGLLTCLEANVWHELGHVFHSAALPVFGFGRAGVASNLLEDLRIEKLLLHDLGEDARAWLRHNQQLAFPEPADVAAVAHDAGWATTLTAIGGRHASGVISDAELAAVVDIVRQVHPTADVAALLPLWTQFVAVADRDLGAPPAVDAVVALAALLPESAALPD